MYSFFILIFIFSSSNINNETLKQKLTKENLNEERKIISFWKPSITISVVDVFYPLKPNAIPEQIRKCNFYLFN